MSVICWGQQEARIEADWEVETGGVAPVIDAHWSGFVDLRQRPERASELPEAIDLPALAAALIQLNGPDSLMWTSKCDIWPIDEGSYDRDELDAPPESATHAIASYIDLLPRSEFNWAELENTVATARTLCALLHAVPIRCCRVDLLIRHAFVRPARKGTGITAYVTACGVSPEAASKTLSAALKVFADVLCGHSTVK